MDLTPGQLYLVSWLDHCQYTSNEIHDPSMGQPPIQFSVGRYMRRSPKVLLFETTWCSESRITSSDILALLTNNVLSAIPLGAVGKEVACAKRARAGRRK